MQLTFKLQHEIDFSIVPALWCVLTCQSVASMIGKLATLLLIQSVRIFFHFPTSRDAASIFGLEKISMAKVPVSPTLPRARMQSDSADSFQIFSGFC